MRIYTQATMMWLEAHSAEFIASSKKQIKEDPEAFWPEEEGEVIGSNWASYPGNREMYFDGDEEEAYIDTELLVLIFTHTYQPKRRQPALRIHPTHPSQ